LLASREPQVLGLLRRAAQRSRLGVLVTTDCLGRCADGPVATVGTVREVDGALRVTPSAVLGPVDATNVQQLAAHLRATAGPVDAPAGPEAGG
jgi:(2Fe-2S) ferredoxin